MNTLEFKTDIKCTGCLDRVSPHMNGNDRIGNWNVDLASPDRILTVESGDISPEELITIVQKAGFKAEPLSR